MTRISKIILFLVAFVPCVNADEPIAIWPNLAPGETTSKTGTQQPFRPNEEPPVVRVTDITYPTMSYHPAKTPNGSAILILPGGGFGKVVTNKEGSELAAILNRHGYSAFVLSYRTKSPADKNGWLKPLQDAQRAISLIRANSEKWNVKSDRVGLVGFSAGGNVAARLLCGEGTKSYRKIDARDEHSSRPDFAMLIYPWNIYDAKNSCLTDKLKVPKTCPPTFIVHTDDDRSTSLGAVQFYAELKMQSIPAAIHVYANGGHGYGTRHVKGSQVGNWPAAATSWLKTLK